MRGSSYHWKTLKDVDQKFLQTLELKQFEEVDRLIKEGANVNVWFGPGDSGLHYFNDIDVITKLITIGANVNNTNSYSETPLMHAISYYKNVEIVKVLLKHGANVWNTNRRRETALSMALRSSCFGTHGSEERIKTLLDFGACIKVTELRYSENVCKLLIKYSMIGEFIPRDLVLNSKPEYVAYFDKCKEEVNVMMAEKLKNSDSLLEIIKNWRCFMMNESFTKLLNEYEQTYPIYADVIFNRIHTPILERRDLLSQLDMVTVTAKMDEDEVSEYTEIVLNVDCKRHIMKFVNCPDLESFLRGTSEAVEAVDSKLASYEPNAKKLKIE